MKQYIGIIRDHSASMRGLNKAAMADYNKLVSDLRENAISKGIDTIISVMECGVYSSYNNATNKMVVSNSSVLGVKQMETYVADGHSTPLYDAVGELIEAMKKVPDAENQDVAFMIMVVTDGEENSSRKYKQNLPSIIADLQNTDRWSFVFRVPRGYRRSIVNALNLHEGNVMEWETTSVGMEVSTKATSSAIDEYYTSRLCGQTATRGFYSTDLTGVSAQKIKNALVEITGQVQFYDVPMVDNGAQIRTFVEAARGSAMKKGSAFYQLTKKEDEVQDYKQIAIRDKKSKAVYAGTNARQLLGLPFNGTVKIVPGVHGNYDIFVQSTSVNRKLVGGTQVMYWDAVGEAYQDTTTRQVKAAPAAPVVKSYQDWFVEGYQAGFADGKAKVASDIRNQNKNYVAGYQEGYKHGRGKKRNLYPK